MPPKKLSEEQQQQLVRDNEKLTNEVAELRQQMTALLQQQQQQQQQLAAAGKQGAQPQIADDHRDKNVEVVQRAVESSERAVVAADVDDADDEHLRNDYFSKTREPASGGAPTPAQETLAQRQQVQDGSLAGSSASASMAAPTAVAPAARALVVAIKPSMAREYVVKNLEALVAKLEPVTATEDRATLAVAQAMESNLAYVVAMAEATSVDVVVADMLGVAANSVGDRRLHKHVQQWLRTAGRTPLGTRDQHEEQLIHMLADIVRPFMTSEPTSVFHNTLRGDTASVGRVFNALVPCLSTAGVVDPFISVARFAAALCPEVCTPNAAMFHFANTVLPTEAAATGVPMYVLAQRQEQARKAAQQPNMSVDDLGAHLDQWRRERTLTEAAAATVLEARVNWVNAQPAAQQHQPAPTRHQHQQRDSGDIGDGGGAAANRETAIECFWCRRRGHVQKECKWHRRYKNDASKLNAKPCNWCGAQQHSENECDAKKKKPKRPTKSVKNVTASEPQEYVEVGPPEQAPAPAAQQRDDLAACLVATVTKARQRVVSDTDDVHPPLLVHVAVRSASGAQQQLVANLDTGAQVCVCVQWHGATRPD